MRVALAEDSVLLREGLARLLAETGFEVVGQSASAEDLLLKVRSYSPDVVIVDTGCLRRTPTRVCVPHKRFELAIHRWACSCSRSTSSSAWR